jgi:hypothetical protein
VQGGEGHYAEATVYSVANVVEGGKYNTAIASNQSSAVVRKNTHNYAEARNNSQATVWSSGDTANYNGITAIDFSYARFDTAGHENYISSIAHSYVLVKLDDGSFGNAWTARCGATITDEPPTDLAGKPQSYRDHHVTKTGSPPCER